jgi:uncharacterized protein (DUF1786 family)
MSRFLLVDIGAGTMDILCYDSESNLHYKAVVKSPVQTVAQKAAGLTGNLVVTGNEMGGGPVTSVLREKARNAKVIMSASAAATLHHSPERVRRWGIQVIEDAEADHLKLKKAFTPLTIGDLQPDRLKRIVSGFGIPYSFDVVGICAQDHGVPPEGVSHLDYRHNIFRAALDRTPFPHALLYAGTQVPPAMNRLTSIARSAAALPADEIYVMDSGMAAILGASLDHFARPLQKIMVLDIATSHTVGAALMGDEIAGFFEYHTRDITLNRLEFLLRNLADGDLTHKQILTEGGHGAYIRQAFGFKSCEIIIATGPKRRLVENTGLQIVLGAPWGDNMMTGTVGLLEAIRRRKGLEPIAYI